MHIDTAIQKLAFLIAMASISAGCFAEPDWPISKKLPWMNSETPVDVMRKIHALAIDEVTFLVADPEKPYGDKAGLQFTAFSKCIYRTKETTDIVDVVYILKNANINARLYDEKTLQINKDFSFFKKYTVQPFNPRIAIHLSSLENSSKYEFLFELPNLKSENIRGVLIQKKIAEDGFVYDINDAEISPPIYANATVIEKLYSWIEKMNWKDKCKFSINHHK